MSSNPILQVNGAGLPRLKAAMALAQWPKAKGYAINPEKGIAFFWAADQRMTAFPAELNMDRCAELAMDWLATADYGREPDHDGDNKRGWLCYCDGWGHIDGFGYAAFIAVKPHWLMFGK